MSDMNLFYSSMSNVLNQWSDFRVAKPLYKYYFKQQQSESQTAAKEAASKFTNEKTASKSTAYSAAANDKLKTYASNVSKSVDNLEAAFKADKDGNINLDKAYNAAESFVNSFNELYSSTRSSGNGSVSGKSQFIANITSAYSNKLEKAGVKLGSDGKLSIDKEAFSSASDEERAEIFGKKNSYASFMSEQANAMSAYANTAAYLDANTTYNKNGTVASSNATALSGVLYNQLF